MVALSVGDGTMEPMTRSDPDTARRLEGLVGRREQLAELTAALDEAAAGRSRVVLLGGEAGSGKTTLVEAFCAQLAADQRRSTQLVVGQCVALGGEGLPYAPIVGALRGLLTTYGREQILEWAGPSRSALGVLLPGIVPGAEQGDVVRLQLFEAVARLLEHAGARRPLVVVLEDIHWADESTRHLLRFLTRALDEAAVLLVADVSHRRADPADIRCARSWPRSGRQPGTVRIELAGLDRDEVAQLLTRLLGHPPTTAVASLVHRRSEGVPYFVEELAQSASRGCVEMPDTLRDALIVRIQAMSDQAQDVVALASVGGQRIEHELLEAVAELPDAQLEAGLREAIDAAVLRIDEDGYVFRHALLREVAHDDLLPGQHARMHARYAAVLESRPGLVGPEIAALEIAHHYSAAHISDKAFRWSIEAAGSRAAGVPRGHEDV